MKINKKNDSRQNLDLKSQFKKVNTGVKNGVFIFSSPLSVEQFATKIDKSASEILKYFFLKGKMLTLNTMLTEEEIGELCLEYNFDFEKRVEIDETNVLSNIEVKDDPASLKPRPPVVTIMGHVDHGKTTLLDYIRHAHVAHGEAGGITQHIGAYQISYKNDKITFIDTPGHAAFTEMRARGANITDIVIIVVAADDGIKPQTEEAIDHAKAAKVPIIVFINKMDKPNVNPDKVMTQLSEKDLLAEEWGGSTITIKGSALNGEGVDKLLEGILAIAEINEYKANPNRLAMGIVIESNIDKGFGPVATILIKNGSLTKGDFIIAGSAFGRIRVMLDENLHEVGIAYPSQPIKITGLSEPPAAGEHFIVSTNEKDIKEIAEKIRLHKLIVNRQADSLINNDIAEGTKIFNVILKTDVHGSLEAIKNMLSKINVTGTKLQIIRSAVGGITESDVTLAKASKAIIIGFNIKPTRATRDIADSQQVKILFFDIIYKLNESIQDFLLGELNPVYEEQEMGEAVIQQLWSHSAIGVIAGCLVQNGEINRNDNARVLRDGKVIINTKISSMKHLKDVVNKVTAGMECGITLEKYNAVKVNDIIQTYRLIAKKRGM
ncbi:MAG: translation initiation factor IF-2 [Mycoplasmataceae bacterium]|nr:translation initiation factor IF-2 [Mycoplasmataceae bacterium]